MNAMWLWIAAGIVIACAVMAGCAGDTKAAAREEIPEPTRKWMERLTVKTAYDPKTGFIVAKEVIALPTVLRGGEGLAAAVERGQREGKPVVVFATADRCGPCQQFKKDALNDERVIAWLESGAVVPVHVEVDREGEAAERVLGSRGIPMSYWIVDGAVAGSLRGQRSAADVLEWAGRMASRPRG